MRRVISLLFLLAWPVVMNANAFALQPGTSFEFSNTYTVGTLLEWEWTHTLDNGDFTPSLTGGEVLTITSALLRLEDINYTPEQSGNSGEFQIKVKTELDEYNIGIIKEKLESGASLTTSWDIPIKSSVLQAIADKSATIELDPIKGTINSIQYSILSGTGVVAPEPVSMLLVGTGMIMLPFAVRLSKGLNI